MLARQLDRNSWMSQELVSALLAEFLVGISSLSVAVFKRLANLGQKQNSFYISEIFKDSCKSLKSKTCKKFGGVILYLMSVSFKMLFISFMLNI